MHDSSQNDEIAQEVSCDSLDENMSINNSSLSMTFTTAGREKELLAPILVVLALHSAFHSIINFGGWISGLLSGGICPAPVSLINIHKPCLSVYTRTSEILYIVSIQKYKLRIPQYTFFNTNTPILSSI